jgi:hypothetical protein
MRREFEITVYPDGTMRIERKGDSDDVCVQEVIPVRQVLGEVVDRRLKGSFGTTPTDVHTHTNDNHPHQH